MSLQSDKSYPFPEVPSNINYHCILQEQFPSTHNHNMELPASTADAPDLVSFKQGLSRIKFLICSRRQLQVVPRDSQSCAGEASIPLCGHRSRSGLRWRDKNAAGQNFPTSLCLLTVPGPSSFSFMLKISPIILFSSYISLYFMNVLEFNFKYIPVQRLFLQHDKYIKYICTLHTAKWNSKVLAILFLMKAKHENVFRHVTMYIIVWQSLQ